MIKLVHKDGNETLILASSLKSYMEDYVHYDIDWSEIVAIVDTDENITALIELVAAECKKYASSKKTFDLAYEEA